jgi:Lon protease-like protein
MGSVMSGVADLQAPMFPLRGVFLFPGQILPLHVFEPRYRRMVEDSLDGAGRIVMANQLEQERPDGPPPAVLPVAGLGEIARYERLPDGRFMLLLFGLARVRIAEIESCNPYRLVRCTTFDEIPVAPEQTEQLCAELAAAIRTRTGAQLETLAEASLPQLVDVLAQCLDLPHELMAPIYSETQLAARAASVLAAHEERPPELK